MSNQDVGFFSSGELARLQSLRGKQLSGVRYVFWMNLASRDGVFEALDWIELEPANGQKISFHAKEDLPGLEIKPLDLTTEQEAIREQFGEQVELRIESMGDQLPWKNVLKNTILEVRLNEERPAQYRNDAVQLDFENHQVAIFRADEGLAVQIFPSKA